MPDLTDDDLAELRRLHDAATAAPWAWEATGDKDNSWGIGVVEDADGNLIAGHNETGENEVIEPVCEAIDGNHADAALIVAMRNALPGLLAEVERLRAAAPASKDDEPATGSFVPVLPGYYEEVARRLAAAGSPPPIPAPEQETTDGR